MCSGGCQFVDDNGSPLGTPDFPSFDDLVIGIFEGKVGPQPLRHTYRTRFAKALQWDPALPCRQDLAFVLQAGLSEPKHIHSNVLTGYKRQHAGGLSENLADESQSPKVHLDILTQAVRQLRKRPSPNPERIQAGLQAIWTWSRIVAPHDESKFEQTLDLIYEIDGSFRPTRSSRILSVLDGMLSPTIAERLRIQWKKIKKSYTRALDEIRVL
jgi:hypothetical protein